MCVCLSLEARDESEKKKTPKLQSWSTTEKGGGLKECGARAKTGSLCEPQRATWDGHYVNTHVNRASGVSPSALPSHSYRAPIWCTGRIHDMTESGSCPAPLQPFIFGSPRKHLFSPPSSPRLYL